MSEALRVVVVDDHRIVRDGLSALLGALDGIEVVGTASDGREAVHLTEETEPDVVLMDIQMPGLDGLEATRFITGRRPTTRVVMLTMNEEDETVLSAVRAGAAGYLLKGSGAVEVEHAVRTAAAGGLVFGSAVAGRVAALVAGATAPPRPPPFPELTERERGVLDLLAAGRSNDEIARALHVSSKTVRNAVSSVYAKLGVPDRAGAIVRARDAGLGRS